MKLERDSATNFPTEMLGAPDACTHDLKASNSQAMKRLEFPPLPDCLGFEEKLQV